MTRGLGTLWLIFALSAFGTLFPHIAARDFLDSPQIVRWISIPLLLVCGVLLASHYLS